MSQGSSVRRPLIACAFIGLVLCAAGAVMVYPPNFTSTGGTVTAPVIFNDTLTASSSSALNGPVTMATVTSYGGQATDTFGLIAIPKSGFQVAWSGAETTIATFSVLSTAFYAVDVYISSTTADTVTVQLTYTDAINNTAQTVNLIDGVALGANGARGAHYPFNATAPTAAFAKISSATQTSTKATAVFTRLR